MDLFLGTQLRYRSPFNLGGQLELLKSKFLAHWLELGSDKLVERIYCPWTNTPLLDATTKLVTDLTTTSKCSTSYFMVSQYCEQLDYQRGSAGWGYGASPRIGHSGG